MQRRYLYLFIIFFSLCISAVHAQSQYFMHTLQRGETLSALAEKYNTSVGDIMRMNQMHAGSRLVYGSQIKIPGQAAMHEAPALQPAGSVDSAITVLKHIIAKGETLFSISRQYNVSVDDIIKWNNLTGNAVAVGDMLNIGGPKTADSSGSSGLHSKVNASEKGEPQQPLIPETITEEPQNKREAPQPVAETLPALTYTGKGFFEKEYHGAFRSSLQGMAMTFKTQAGWNDGKFYILMNDADPGSVVKVESADGKTIYAKVLMSMQEIKENNGLSFRLSNAAAAALGITESRFGVTVSW